jgi:hypothetical protein
MFCIPVPFIQFSSHRAAGPCNWDLSLQVQAYLKDVKARGVPVAVFGVPGGGLARDFRSWRYLYENGEPPKMEKTEKLIEYCVDLRLPPRFEVDDFEIVAECLLEGFKACGPPARGG